MDNRTIMKDVRRRFVNAHAITIVTVSIVEIIGYIVFILRGTQTFSFTNKYMWLCVVLPIVVNFTAHFCARYAINTLSLRESAKDSLIVYAALATSIVVSISHREFIITSCAFIFPVILSTFFNNRKLLNQCTLIFVLSSLETAFILYTEGKMDLTMQLNMVILFGFVFICYLCAGIAIDFSEKSQKTIEKHEADNELLRHGMLHDSMTGLYNHRAFHSILEKAMEDYRVNMRKVCLAVIDIDDFKKVNDTYGHGYGDAVIVKLANIINKHCKDYKACRYGGEEFAIVFYDINIDEAKGIVEEILKEFSEYKFVFTSDRFTFSCGISQYDGLKAKDEMFSEADDNMYAAKRNGKNRIVIS